MTGLRGIPARYLPRFLKTKGDAYDFETNMILDLKRYDIPFRTFPIVGEYFADGSTSHYRPFVDSFKIIAELLRFFGQQFKYMGSSLVCYAAEYVLFRLFLGYLPELGVTLSNYLCRLLAGSANFLINKNIVFGVKKSNPAVIVKYILVALFVMLVSTQMIVVVNWLFHTEGNTAAKLVKIPVDVVMFFVGYFLQKKWVFKKK
jgi:putative flippase GtrA